MSHQSATVECPTYPGLLACPIRVRYSKVPGTFAKTDFAAGGCDCHLVHVQPAPDRKSMEVHFTGCPSMLAGLSRMLEVYHIESESLLCSFAGEYRQAGLFVGTIGRYLDANSLVTRLRRTGRPVELVGRVGFLRRRARRYPAAPEWRPTATATSATAPARIPA